MLTNLLNYPVTPWIFLVILLSCSALYLLGEPSLSLEDRILKAMLIIQPLLGVAMVYVIYHTQFNHYFVATSCITLFLSHSISARIFKSQSNIIMAVTNKLGSILFAFAAFAVIFL